MPVTIATAPINWHNDADPSGLAPLSYPAILDDAAAAGYRATEWSASLPGFVPALRRDLAERGLALTAAYLPVSLHRPGWHEPTVAQALERARFLARLGARHLVIGEAGDEARARVAGRVGPDDGLGRDAFAALAAGLEAIGVALRATGVRPVFHPHVATYVETAEETLRLSAAVDGELMGFCLDSGHAVYGGADARALLAALGPRVEYVHLKDVDGEVLASARRERWTFVEALARVVFCDLGEGVADVDGLLADLSARDYDGVVVLEQDTSWNPPVSVRHARDHVRGRMGW
jgi:inosose dehydratase